VLSDECRAVEQSDEWRDLDLDETAAKAFRRQAWHAVAGYWQTEDPQQIDVVALERWVKAEVSGVPLRGIVDRLERDVFGDLCVSDYKTGKVPAPAFRDGKFRQLNLYAAMIKAVDGELPTDGRLLFTTYGKVIGTSIDRQSVEDAVEVAVNVWSDLERAEAQQGYEPKPGPLCGWCPFAGECEAGLSELVERFQAGRLKNTAPAWALAAAKAAEA
jgi:putative RecB family exonuclease